MPLIVKYCPLFLLSFLVNSFLYSNPIKKLGSKEGLSNAYVKSITQDADGFLWVATEAGLNKFDGKSFAPYLPDAKDSTSISTNSLNKVLADGNTIWIATQRNGLSAFDKTTQTFLNYPVSGNAPNALRANGITDLCLGKGDILWIATYQNGFKKLDKRTHVVSHYSTQNISGLKSDNIWGIALDDSENLYIGHVNEGMSIVSIRDNSAKHFSHQPNDPHSLPGNSVRQIYIDSKNNIWLATSGGLALYQPRSENFISFRHKEGDLHSLINNDVSCLKEINGKLWIGISRGGISILDLQDVYKSPENLVFENILANDFPEGLSHPSVSSLYQDVFHNIWIGTSGGGINFISHQDLFFKTIGYSPIIGYKNSLSNKVVSSLCIDKEKRLWAGTEGGGIDVYKAGEKTGNYSREKKTLPDNVLLSALTDSRGEIWFGSKSTGIIHFNKKTNCFERFNHPLNRKDYSHVRCIFEDSSRHIWFGMDAGILTYNPGTNALTFIDGKEFGLPNNLIRSISQDRSGNLWIGTLIDGFSIVSADRLLIRNFKIESGFLSNGVNHIYKDSKGWMWLATRNGIAYFPDGEILKHSQLTKKDGLDDDFVRAVTEGKTGEIWASTNSGISRYGKKSGKIDNYDHHESVPWGVYMNASVAKSEEGIIYFGSQNGICYFNSTKSPETIVVPEARITRFMIYDPESVQGENMLSVPVASKMKLAYNQNTFTLDFNVMDYSLQDIVNYTYSMEGFDNVWYQTNGENQVTFRNIPPGKYVFHVKANARNQDSSGNTTTIQIEITPPFWLSWWAKTFYLLAALFILLLIFGFYKRKLNLENLFYLEKENHKKEQELNDEKLRFYTNIAHELRTPLTLIMGPLEDLSEDNRLEQDQRKSLSLIYKSASRLANLTNQILEFRKSETNNRKLCVMYGEISSLLQEIGLKYKELNRNKALSLEVLIEKENLKLYFDTEVITIILDNLISNAFKYTFEGVVSIILRSVLAEGKPYAEIEVKDTGSGISEDSLDKIFDRYYQVKNEHQAFGTGIGLSLVKNMVQLHEGTIQVRSKENEGTSFYIRLAVENTYPKAIHLNSEEQISKSASETKPLLLVIEDNVDIREYIAHSFIDDFDVLTAENGEEGIELAFEKLPDIIISDIMMPIMDGIQLTKSIKEDMRTSHIPVILLTAKDSTLDRTKGYSMGADSYITKPFNGRLLRTRIKNLLESREKIKKIFSSSSTYKKAIFENSLNELDNEFIQKTVKIIEDNLDSEQINIGYLADQMFMSHSTFYRKIKALTGMTAAEFIRKIKLQHAEQLLLSGKYTISEIGLKIGFNGSDSLRKAFKAEFGLSPSEYLKKLEDQTDT